MPRKKIGEFSPELIKILHLDISAGTPIYIADSNIEHMKSSHPKDFQKYGNDIESIIASPDYVGRKHILCTVLICVKRKPCKELYHQGYTHKT